jgi:hypothetical protein
MNSEHFRFCVNQFYVSLVQIVFRNLLLFSKCYKLTKRRSCREQIPSCNLSCEDASKKIRFETVVVGSMAALVDLQCTEQTSRDKRDRHDKRRDGKKREVCELFDTEKSRWISFRENSVPPPFHPPFHPSRHQFLSSSSDSTSFRGKWTKNWILYFRQERSKRTEDWECTRERETSTGETKSFGTRCKERWIFSKRANSHARKAIVLQRDQFNVYCSIWMSSPNQGHRPVLLAKSEGFIRNIATSLQLHLATQAKVNTWRAVVKKNWTYYIKGSEDCGQHTECKIWGSYGGHYKECRLLEYKTQFVPLRGHITSPLQSPAG